MLREATLLINVTNNGWFGDSMAPHQHLQIARMRALEAERYLVQASNDGMTAAVDARGRDNRQPTAVRGGRDARRYRTALGSDTVCALRQLSGGDRCLGPAGAGWSGAAATLRLIR